MPDRPRLPDAPATLFASDNASGVHPEVMEALARANAGHALAYGADEWTERATDRFRQVFDAPVEVFLTWGGTGANVVGLQTVLSSWQAVICPRSAHIAEDECGAVERFTGSKLIEVPTADGKLRPDDLVEPAGVLGVEHRAQPHVVSITQSTEMGTLYSVDELGAVVEAAHGAGFVVHVDGARIANAAAALDVDLRTMLVDTGVDLMTFGGTKNGMMYGEAVVFLRPELATNARFVRKQAGQLPSKMRYVAAQFEALLTDDLWLRNARHANEMATRLATAVERIPGVDLLGRPLVNGVFARVPAAAVRPLQEWSFFWVWDAAESVVRWMCSFDTSPDDVDAFAAGVAEIVATATS